MKICWAATRIRRCSLLALILIAGLFLVPSQQVSGQDGSGEQPVSLTYVQLAEFVGPIALYPDKLIVIILPVSTYPLEVVQADRLLEKSKNKMPEEMIKKLDFDPSVLALMHYPEVLDKMNKDLDWTTKLGDAVANEQEEVMAAIQRFRAEALAAGNLVSNDQVAYTTQASTITVHPTRSACQDEAAIPAFARQAHRGPTFRGAHAKQRQRNMTENPVVLQRGSVEKPLQANSHPVILPHGMDTVSGVGRRCMSRSG